jgi:hypothetical protein
VSDRSPPSECVRHPVRVSDLSLNICFDEQKGVLTSTFDRDEEGETVPTSRAFTAAEGPLNLRVSASVTLASI